MNQLINKLRLLKQSTERIVQNDTEASRVDIPNKKDIANLRKKPGQGSCRHQDLHQQLHKNVDNLEQLDEGLYRISKRIKLQHSVVQGFGQFLPYKSAGDIQLKRLVFLDTETNGLGTSTGTIAFMIGLMVIEDGYARIDQFLITRYDMETRMLDYICDYLESDSVLVSYNGKQFDVPLLKSRLRLCTKACCFQQTEHLDLLYPVRLAFSGVWPDCSLQMAEKKLLGIYRQGDMPGSESPIAWIDMLRFSKADRVVRLLEHNLQDLHSLLLLLHRLDEVYTSPGDFTLDRVRIARRKVKENRLEEACNLLIENDSESAKLLLTSVYKKMGLWQKAEPLWRELAAGGCQHSMLELAKCYEHKYRDYARAYSLSKLLFQLTPSDQHAKRIDRLRSRTHQISFRESRSH